MSDEAAAEITSFIASFNFAKCMWGVVTNNTLYGRVSQGEDTWNSVRICGWYVFTLRNIPGSPFPDVPLTHLASKTVVRLSEIAKPGRPLVLNFGSCT